MDCESTRPTRSKPQSSAARHQSATSFGWFGAKLIPKVNAMKRNPPCFLSRELFFAVLERHRDTPSSDFITGFVIFAFERQLGFFLRFAVPLPERIAIPRALRPQGRQAELFLPDLLGLFHVFLGRQGDRWKRLFQRRVHQHHRIFRRAFFSLFHFVDVVTRDAKRWSVALFASSDNTDVFGRLASHRERPIDSVGVFGIDIFI